MGRYSAKDVILSIIGFFGAIASYFSGFELFKKLYITSTETMAAVSYIILFSMIIVVAFVFREFQVARKEKYANITEKLHDIFHDIRNLQTLMASAYPDGEIAKDDAARHIAECKSKLTDILNNAANIFHMLTSTRCRASIKCIFDHHDYILYLDTLCRDHTSANRWRDLDNKRVREDVDKLEDNLTLRKILTEDTPSWHYFCNDLTSSSSNYHTTSTQAYEDYYRSKSSERKWLNPRQWVLPYKSTIVCAIRQPPIDRFPDNVEAVGLLCIDSESRNVFVEQWDVQLCFAIADALYHPVSELLELMDIAKQLDVGELLTDQKSTSSSPQITLGGGAT